MAKNIFKKSSKKIKNKKEKLYQGVMEVYWLLIIMSSTNSLAKNAIKIATNS